MTSVPTGTDETAQPLPMQLQYGEVVDITIRGARAKTGMPDGSVLFEVDDRLLALTPTGAVSIKRTEPADGEPQPGDLWRDHDDRLYAAVRRGEMTVLCAVTPDPHDAHAGGFHGWRDLHAGTHGPIRLIHRDDPDEVPW